MADRPYVFFELTNSLCSACLRKVEAKVIFQEGLFRYQRIKLYLIAYLIYWFFTEFVRPEPVVALGLTAYQWGALALIPVFAWLWHRDAAALSFADK